MKTRNLLAGIFTILVISGYAMGQEFWLPNSTHIYNTNSGNVGIGTTNPSERLHIAGSVRGNQYGAIRISTGYGYVDIGPKNTSWSHFVTDRGRFYFNKGITIDTGYLGSYNQNLYLQISGTTRMTILNSTGNVGIGTANPGQKLDIVENADGLKYLEYNNQNTGTSAGAGVWAFAYGNNVFMRAYGDGHDVPLKNLAEIGTTTGGTDLAIFAGSEKVRIKSNGSVSLVVYDIMGREVARLVDGHLEPGYHAVVWNSKTAHGRDLPSGIYIARLVTPKYTKSIKMLLLK